MRKRKRRPSKQAAGVISSAVEIGQVSSVLDQAGQTAAAAAPQAMMAKTIPMSEVNTSSGTKIGEGTFGVVWKATFRLTDCAAKMLRPERMQSQSAITALLSEMDLMTNINHPNVVKIVGIAVHESGWREGVAIVMELLQASLDDVLSLQPFQPYVHWGAEDSALVPIAIDMTKGMAYLHFHGIVHRNLKPCLLYTSPSPRDA